MGNKEPNRTSLPSYDWQLKGNHNGLDLYQRNDGLIAERRRVTLDHHFDINTEK